MKNYKLFVSMMLISVVTFFSSCSDDEDVFYYSFKDIEYMVGSDDGMTEYETPWEECYILVNKSETSEVKAGPSDIYIGYRDRYKFQCSDASTFNPTPGYVHVPLPESLTSGNRVVFEEKEGEYSMEEVDTNRSKESKMYTIPPKTKLVLERKVVMKKLTLTYAATFQRHPAGKDHVVAGKFIRYIPVGIALIENYQPVNE